VPRKSAHLRRERRPKTGDEPVRPVARDRELTDNEPIEAKVLARDELPAEEAVDGDSGSSIAPEDKFTSVVTESRLPGIEESEQADAEERSSGQLVPVDPLSRYLAELRRFPVLSREQESEIARRYYKYRDPEDAYRLVTANLRLVVKIANEFARASRNLLDLIQEGTSG